MLFRLDLRKVHQIADQRLQPVRLTLDNAEEFLRGRRVDPAFILAKRLDIAEDRGQRRAQFVAGIGDEISMRAADIGLGGLVREFKHGDPLVDRLPVDLPDILPPHEPAHDRHTAAVVVEQ